MDIVVSQEQGRVPVTVFQLKGDLNAATYEQFQSQVQQAIQNGTHHLLVDLSGVAYMSSAGIRALNQIYNWLNAGESAATKQTVNAGVASGTFRSPFLKLLNPTNRVLEVLKLAGFDMFLDIFKNRQEAIASF